MRKIGKLLRLIGPQNVPIVQTAKALVRFYDFGKSHRTEQFPEVFEVKGGAMLPITEDKIGKPAAQRITVVGPVGKPGCVSLHVSDNRISQTGNGDAYP